MLRMIRERSFLQRGQRIEVRDLTDVTALYFPKPSHKPLDESSLAEKFRLGKRLLMALAPDLQSTQITAFETAGWFFNPSQMINDFPEGLSMAKVFVKVNGHLAIGTDHLTVQLKEDLSLDQAEPVFHLYGCQVLKKLKFATGLYLVKVKDADFLDVADEMVASGSFRFVEPELIEILGLRG